MNLTCGAKKRDDNACGAHPVKGGKLCIGHGGKALQVQVAAARRVVEVAGQKAAGERSADPRPARGQRPGQSSVG